MAVAVKGLLKSLRYISNIFEEEHEPEIQIGVPTDVKHVAHIGWDGPTASAPSWMNQFRGNGEPAAPSPPQGSGPVAESRTRPLSKGSKHGSGGSTDSPRRRQPSSNLGADSVDSQPQATKPARRKKAKGSSSGSGSGGPTSSRTAAKPKSAMGRKAGTDPDLEGG